MNIFRIQTAVILLILLFAITTALPQKQDKSYYRHQLQLGADLERLGQYKKAVDLYLRLYKDVPNDYTLYLGAKRCLINLGEFNRLEKFIKESFKRSGRIEYQVDLGEVRYRKGDENGAFKHWENLIQQNPKRQDVYRHIGQALTQLRLYDEAIGLYLRGRDSVGIDGLFVHELANLYIIRMDYALVTEEYVCYLKRQPRQLSYVEARIASFAKTPEIVEKVVGVFKKAINKDVNLVAPLHQLMAGIFLRVRDYERAFEHYRVLEELTEEGTGKSVDKKKSHKGSQLYSFASAAQRDGAYQYAKQAYDLVVAKYPDSPLAIPSQLEAAHCLESLGTKKEAVAAYERFLRNYPKVGEASQAMFRIGEIYFLERMDLKQAKSAYLELLKKYPRSKVRYDALFRLGDCSLMMSQLDEAEQIYNKISSETKSKKGDIYELALLKTAQLHFYRGQFEEAKKQLDQIATLAQPLSGEHASKAMNDALELGILIDNNLNDKEALARYAESQLLILQRQLDSVRVRLEELISDSPENSILDESLMALGKVQRELGDFYSALATFTRIVNWPDENIYQDQAQWQIAEIYETGLFDLQSAQTAYEELLAKYPQSVLLEDARRRVRELERETKSDT